jgi:hypothetical protein
MRLALLLLAALAAAPAVTAAGEAEDLADAYLAAGKPIEAIQFYRKAISRQPSDAGLWEKYDRAHEALLLASGRVARPSPPPPLSQAGTGASTPALPAASPATLPVTAPSPVTSAPAAAPAPAAGPIEPQPVVYRPGERVTLPEPAGPGGAQPPPIVDGDRFRIEEMQVGYTSAGSVKVTGRVFNSGLEPLNRPVIYVGIFDRQQSMVGRSRAYLSHGTYFLPPGASEEFTVGFPTYTGPVSSFSVELVGGQ